MTLFDGRPLEPNEIPKARICFPCQCGEHESCCGASECDCITCRTEDQSADQAELDMRASARAKSVV